MKVTREKTENSEAFLTVEMEPAEVEESLEKSYYRLVKTMDIPGFRKGKVPRAILERYIGKESLLEDALNHLLPQACEKAIIEQGIEAIARPTVEIAQTDPVVFKVTVALPPTIELGDYHHIQATQKPIEFTEEDVNVVIEQLRHRHATWEPVERPAAFNDLVVLNIKSDIEGEPFLNQEGVQYQILRNSSFPAPGFAEQLPEMKNGEDKEFKLQLPLDHPKGELAGKEASFKIRVTEIKQERLPELNDGFAIEVAPDCKSLDSLREQLSTDLRLRAEEKAKIDFEEQVIEAVANITELEFPPVLVEREIDRLLNQWAQRWQIGSKGMEDYLRNINKTGEELREELRPVATKRVTQSLVLGKVAEGEKIEVSDSEINAEVEKMTKSAAENKDELQKFLDTSQGRGSIEQILMTRKTIQRLVEIAKGSNKSIETIQKEEKSE